MTGWSGVFPAVTTKFTPGLELDHLAMEKHFARQIESGVDGLITTGSLGEASTLEPDEKLEVARIALDTAGGSLPVIATVAERTTASAVRFAERAAAAGVAGLMVLPGMQYVSDRREAVTHLRAVARAVELPIMVYSNPVAYRVDFDIPALEELAAEANVVAIKESSDDVRRVTEIRARFGDRFRIFAGVDNLALESFQMGADGWVAGLVNAFPEETVAIFRLSKEGRLPEALAIYRWFAPLLKLDVSTKLVQNIKLVEAIVGVGSEFVRPPRLPLAGAEREAVAALVRQALATRPRLVRPGPERRSAGAPGR
jgi:4-hydroxy-tetrahydrodipicolinate synthase